MRTQSTVCGAGIALAAAMLAADPLATTPTFSRDIRPILQAHCTICHSPGGPSPMPLVTYEDALPWARKIKEQALTRHMPVWHAARGYGAFENDPTLAANEIRLLVEWADQGAVGAMGAVGASGAGAGGAAGAGATGALSAGAETATIRTWNGWITGWTFVPWDPLISSATFVSADGSTIGTWTAGDRPVRLPHGSAIRVTSPVSVEIHRRKKTTYEAPFTPRNSALRFSWLTAPEGQPRPQPARRVWTERLACGTTLGPAESTIIGVRPLIPAGAAVQIAVERLGGAPPVLLGWFRDFDPLYARIYWLAQPIEFAANARLTSDAPCQLDVILAARRSSGQH